MNAVSLVRKARRSIANSARQIENLQAVRQEILDYADSQLCDRDDNIEIFRNVRHIERRLKHHRANIAKLQAFATLDREQAQGLIAWLDSARAERREDPSVADPIPEQSRDDELDDLLARLSDPLPATDVRRPTRYEAILNRLGFGIRAAA